MIRNSFFYRSFCECEYQLGDLVNRISEIHMSRSISGKHLYSTELQNNFTRKTSQITVQEVFLIIASHILQRSICTNRENIWWWLITESSIISCNSWEISCRFCESGRFRMSREIRRGEPEWKIEISILSSWIVSYFVMTEADCRHTEWDIRILLGIEIFWEYNCFFFAQDNAPRMRISLEELYLIIGDLAIFAEHTPIRYEECESLIELSTRESIYLMIIIWRIEISSESVAGICRDDGEHTRGRWVKLRERYM